MHPFILQTDASNQDIEAMLSQESVGVDRSIAYASCKFNPLEQRYATIKWECLAIKWWGGVFTLLLTGPGVYLKNQSWPPKMAKIHL